MGTSNKGLERAHTGLVLHKTTCVGHVPYDNIIYLLLFVEKNSPNLARLRENLSCCAIVIARCRKSGQRPNKRTTYAFQVLTGKTTAWHVASRITVPQGTWGQSGTFSFFGGISLWWEYWPILFVGVPEIKSSQALEFANILKLVHEHYETSTLWNTRNEHVPAKTLTKITVLTSPPMCITPSQPAVHGSLLGASQMLESKALGGGCTSAKDWVAVSIIMSCSFKTSLVIQSHKFSL